MPRTRGGRGGEREPHGLNATQRRRQAEGPTAGRRKTYHPSVSKLNRCEFVGEKDSIIQSKPQQSISTSTHQVASLQGISFISAKRCRVSGFVTLGGDYLLNSDPTTAQEKGMLVPMVGHWMKVFLSGA